MRVLFCGLGGIGQRHLRCLREIFGPQLEVHAFRVRGAQFRLRDDLSVDPTGQLDGDFGIVVHRSLESALAKNPQAVFICNPSSLHIDIAIEAARKGIHLFIEKPLSSSLERVEELQRIVTEKKLVCYVGYNFRFHPALIRLKEYVDSKKFGNIIRVSSIIAEYLPAWHPYEDYRSMYAAREDLGGGVILSQIHEFDLVYWLFGLPRSIYSLGGKLSDLEVDVEDVAISLMCCDGESGWFPVTVQQDFLQRPAERSFTVVGDAASAKVDLRANSITVFDSFGSISYFDGNEKFQRNDMFMAQAKHFFNCIDGEAKPAVDIVSGISSLRMALAAKESILRKSVVQLL